jgi:predicted Fe-Mo cluster-binding NifX family protein
MAKIGMTLSRDRLEDPLAQHFGKAKWLLVWDSAGGAQFIPNQGLNGRWVAETFAAAGCTLVVANHLGPGALVHLREAGIRVLEGAPDKAAVELARLADKGELPDLLGASPHPAGSSGCGH